MARQLIVQPHFLHLTTQATGSPKFRPVIRAMIGEQTTKVISFKKMGPPRTRGCCRVAKSDKLVTGKIHD